MRNIDVCLSPELLRLYNLEERIVVVVDILRATSCMVTALGQGIRRIVPFADADSCMQMRRSGFLVAGERNGEKLDGFDLGNSPLQFLEEDHSGENLAMTTTNGTYAISESKGAKEVVIGSFLNISALSEYLRSKEEDVIIVCAAWKGKVNLEDTLFAGALINTIKDEFSFDCDAPKLAETAWLAAKDDLHEYLSNSSHVMRLKNLNIQKDVEYCLETDKYDLIPILKGDEIVAKYI